MTLKELATEYRKSAQLLSIRLKELRTAKKTAPTAEERWRINRRIAALEPILTHTNKVADLLEHYYERGYYRDPSYSINAFDYRLQGGALAKETSSDNRRERTDGGPEGYVSGVLCRRFYNPSNRGSKRRKQEHGVSHAEKSRAQNPKISSISLKTDEDISNIINQFLQKKEK